MKEPPTLLTGTADHGQESTAREPAPSERERFLLWVDGVGGFLICLASRVLLGHGATESEVDVPILADVARKHAWLERDAHGYVVEALRPVQIHRSVADLGGSLPARAVPATSASERQLFGKKGLLSTNNPVAASAQAVAGRALVRHGELLTLGKSCQFAFAQAVPVSASARLDLVSGHRLWRALHGVLLMAETLVLGPGPAVHVQIADLPQPVVLFRQKTGLAVHYPGKIWMNGQSASDRCPFEAGSRLTVEDMSLSLERVGAP